VADDAVVAAPAGGLMDAFSQAVVWLNDPLNWTNPDGVLARTREHLEITTIAVLLACLIALPLGIWLGHVGRGGTWILALSNLTRAVPTVALLTILPLTLIGFGRPPIVVAMMVFAIPPLLANAHLGMREVDPQVRDAAAGMGMSMWQRMARAELPLAVPHIAAGFRTAYVQVLATTTLAAFVNGGGLGMIISRGFGLGLVEGGGQIVAGGLLVIVLCLAAEAILAVVERRLTPAPLRRNRANNATPAGPDLEFPDRNQTVIAE
jgi:osmoprotectant transport system permease protein